MSLSKECMNGNHDPELWLMVDMIATSDQQDNRQEKILAHTLVFSH